MKPCSHPSEVRTRRFSILLAAALVAVPVLSYAQTPPRPAARVARPARAPKVEGLDGLDEQTLGAELSGRGVNSLLEYFFKVNHVPEDKQLAIKTFGALAELNKPTASAIPYREKLRRVRDVAAGIDGVLPSLKDPIQMMTTANTLIELGVNREVNDIEYWGEDPVTQANLKPVADAVVKLFSAAASTAQQQAEDLTVRGDMRNQLIANRWDALDKLKDNATYAKNMSVYFDCLAYPQKDPARKTMATNALAYLADLDNGDSGVQARVRNMMAKLDMAAGEYKESKRLYGTVDADPSEVKPAPNPFEQYEARYFSTVNDVLAGDLPSAQADKTALDGWQTGTLPQLLAGAKLPQPAIDETLKGVAAAGQMLQWRILVLQHDMAKSEADKNAADAAAEKVLIALRETRPDLAGRIDEQLVKRMPANKVIDDKMAASLLLALLKKAMVESYKQEPEKPDPIVLNKGIEAANVIIHRTDRAGITAAQEDEASLSIPILLERLNKPAEAATAYIDYAVKYYKTNPKKATDSLDRAGFLVFDMKKTAPPGFADVYAKFLPIAIAPPFNHKELAYSYAEQLRALKNPKDAIKFYRMVTADSPAYNLAKYKIMLVLGDLLDTKQDAAEHKQTVTELMAAAEEVRKFGEHPKDQFDRAKAVQATLVLADLARIEEKNPKRTLAVLEGFDELVKGLPGEPEMLRGAQVARVNAYMALGETEKAVAELTKLVINSKGDEGIALIRALLDQLDKEFARANLAHNKDAMRVTAKNEATLTGYLVNWAKPTDLGGTQTNPAISKLYYAYAAYDARTQRLAGSMADADDRKKLLQVASDRFRTLMSPPMHQLYLSQPAIKKQIDAAAISADDPDPTVSTGLALTQFDLGDYDTAQKELGNLIANKKLGTPQVESVDPLTGSVVVKDNDLYWEGMVKFIKSDYEVAKKANNAKGILNAAQSLKNMLVRGGIPERWADDYEALRKEIAPDYNPAPTAQSPTSQPTASAGPAASAVAK